MPITTVQTNPNTGTQAGGAEPRGLGLGPFGYSSSCREAVQQLSFPNQNGAWHTSDAQRILVGLLDPKAVPNCPADIMGASQSSGMNRDPVFLPLHTWTHSGSKRRSSLRPETPVLGSHSRKSSSSLGAASQLQALSAHLAHLSLLRLRREKAIATRAPAAASDPQSLGL